MEKSCHSSSNGGGGGDGGGEYTLTTTTTTTTSNSCATTTSSTVSTSSNNSNNNNNSNRDGYLKHLNKISHKISKPIRRPPPAAPVFDQNNPQNPDNPSSQVQAAAAQLQQSQQQQQQQQQQQHQPPVYNINKNDFRDVVQRLTGSPAHERFSTPPPIQPPKPPSSRLQRIRPPPLAQISNRPPPLAHYSTRPNHPGSNMLNGGGPAVAGFLPGQRQPLSPLPPFPAVHAAAESPISAYMRFLQTSVSSAASPRWNNLPPPTQMPPPPQQPAMHQHQQQNIPPPPQGFPQFPILPPTSPMPFGCIPSPRSPYALLSPSLLFSPTGQLGFPQLPLSPSLPVPSPKWKGI